MAAITFEAMVPDFSGYLTGCPDVAVQLTALRVARELCQWGKVWKAPLADIAVADGTESVVPVSPYAYAEVMDFCEGDFVRTDATKSVVDFKRLEEVRKQYSGWPESSEGTPRFITTETVGGPWLLCPVSNLAGNIRSWAYLRPTATATFWEDELYAEHQLALFHGVLYYLQSMRGRPWANAQDAVMNGKRWFSLRAEARYRALGDYNSGPVTVEMSPLA